MTPETPEQSPVERIKSQSDYLRGRIAAELAEPTDRFSDDTSQLLKHHGIYQQDDRDRRQHLGLPGKPSESGRAYSFMVRTAITGGRLTSEQFLAELDLADEFGNGAYESPAARICNSMASPSGTWRPCCGGSTMPASRPLGQPATCCET